MVSCPTESPSPTDLVMEPNTCDLKIRFSGGLNNATLETITAKLKSLVQTEGLPVFERVDAHPETISRMGGGWSASIWVTFSAGAVYVGKKGVDLIFEIFKKSLMTEKDEPSFTIELYGPDDKILARWRSQPKDRPEIITRSVVPPKRWFERIWRWNRSR